MVEEIPFTHKILNAESANLISDITSALPPELYSSISLLITILQTLGIIFIIYLVFLIINIIFNIKRYKIIKKIWEKINEIEKKLDKKNANKKKFSSKKN